MGSGPSQVVFPGDTGRKSLESAGCLWDFPWEVLPGGQTPPQTNLEREGLLRPRMHTLGMLLGAEGHAKFRRRHRSREASDPAPDGSGKPNDF